MENFSVGGGRDVVCSSQFDEANVDALMALVLKALPVDATRYPATSPMNALEIQLFCVKHSALHFSKTAGQLAAIAEAIDHGAELKTESLRKIAVSSLVNALKLADEVGLTSKDLVEEISQKYL